MDHHSDASCQTRYISCSSLCAGAWSFSVSELAAPGVEVGRLTAADPDLGENAQLEFTILDAEEAEIFNITARDREGIIELNKVSDETRGQTPWIQGFNGVDFHICGNRKLSMQLKSYFPMSLSGDVNKYINRMTFKNKRNTKNKKNKCTFLSTYYTNHTHTSIHTEVVSYNLGYRECAKTIVHIVVQKRQCQYCFLLSDLM